MKTKRQMEYRTRRETLRGPAWAVLTAIAMRRLTRIPVAILFFLGGRS